MWETQVFYEARQGGGSDWEENERKAEGDHVQLLSSSISCAAETQEHFKLQTHPATSLKALGSLLHSICHQTAQQHSSNPSKPHLLHRLRTQFIHDHIYNNTLILQDCLYRLYTEFLTIRNVKFLIHSIYLFIKTLQHCILHTLYKEVTF